jgi:hypothetical protein
MVFEEMIHMMSPKADDPYVGFLVMVSLLRDDVPWLYELGMEVYRAWRGNRKSAAREALSRFRHAMEFTLHGPLGEEFMMRSKEGHMAMMELEHMMERVTDRHMRIDEEQTGEKG